MNKISAVVWLLIICVLSGCGKSTPSTPKKNEVTSAEANAMLQKLSLRLKKNYDDMKELTYYFSPVGEDMSVIVEPYVAVDKDYRPTLCEHLQYFGSHRIRFDTLYIKSANQTFNFPYRKAEYVSYNSESYGGVMSDEVYQALKAAVESGYVRVRMEGKAGLVEKELSQQEIAGIKSVFEIYEYLNQVKVVN